MNYKDAQYQNNMKEYFNETKRNSIKETIKNIVLFILSLVNRLLLYPYLSEIINKNLTKYNVSDTVIGYILLAYLMLSMIFIMVTTWRLVKNIKIINILYVLLVVGYIGYFFVHDFKNTQIYNAITNKPSISFVIEAKDICNKAKTYWQRETVTNSAREATYIKSKGEYCTDKFLITDDSTEFLVKLDVYGNITEFIITNGRFQYQYNGNGLNVDDISIDEFVKVEPSNQIVIPDC